MLSTKAYDFIRDLKAYPLPGKTTLEDYFGSFNITPGFLDSVAELISFKIPSMDKVDRITAISFDEMHLTKAIGKPKILRMLGLSWISQRMEDENQPDCNWQ